MFNKAINYLSDIIYLKKEDVILAAYPKTGSTWLRFICFNIINLNELNCKLVDFDLLNEEMIAFGQGRMKRDWVYNSLPRIIKTHRIYNKLMFRNNRVILLMRDPRDVMISLYHAEKARRKKYKQFKGDSLLDLMEHPNLGIEAMMEHYESWKDRAGVIIKYEELKRNTFKEFNRVLKFLQVEVENQILKQAIKRSEFQNIQKIEVTKGHNRRESRYRSDFKFTRKGEINQWKEEFGEVENNYYKKMKKRYNFGLY